MDKTKTLPRLHWNNVSSKNFPILYPTPHYSQSYVNNTIPSDNLWKSYGNTPNHQLQKSKDGLQPYFRMNKRQIQILKIPYNSFEDAKKVKQKKLQQFDNIYENQRGKENEKYRKFNQLNDPKEDLIHHLQSEMKILRKNMNKSQKEKQEKFRQYESEIIGKMKQNSVLKDSVIKDIKERLGEQQGVIKQLRFERNELTQALEVANNLLKICQQKLVKQDKKFEEMFKDYENIIEEKEEIIKKMSFFNDELCFTMIKKQEQLQIAFENNLKNEQKYVQKITERKNHFNNSYHQIQTPHIAHHYYDSNNIAIKKKKLNLFHKPPICLELGNLSSLQLSEQGQLTLRNPLKDSGLMQEAAERIQRSERLIKQVKSQTNKLYSEFNKGDFNQQYYQ